MPPQPEVPDEFLDNWKRYYHLDRPDPLVQLAIIHAQFEVLHPFLDGNGRLGRLIIPSFLFEKGILSRPMFYLSAYTERHRDEYVHALRDLGHQPDAWDNWVAFFLNALFEQAQENNRKARQILDLYEQLKDRVITLTHSQFAVPLLGALPMFASVKVYVPPLESIMVGEKSSGDVVTDTARTR